MLSARAPAAAAAAYDFAALRAREFARLDASGLAYLDYAASALHADSQLRAHHALLAQGVFATPQSESAPARASTDAIEHARALVRRFFDVDASTHEVVFTANASAAIRLVAESYPFDEDAALVLAADNHNSVNGVRAYARRAGAAVHVLPRDAELRLDAPARHLAAYAAAARRGRRLLAYPAQSNFSGVRHPLALVAEAQALGHEVLLDVAAYAPGHPLSLRACPADFAALSFYKLFGYPTGVGALVARRDALARLRRPWFAGGTVSYASVAAARHRLHDGHAGFEDGTPDFLGLAALAPGFALLDEVGLPRLQAHAAGLTRHLLARLAELRHASGARVVRLHGPADLRERGGTVAFDVVDADGQVVPYDVVEVLARRAGIALRGGCFCNPGAAEAAFGLEPVALAACLDRFAPGGAEAFSLARLAACLGRPVGAVRLSLGLANHLGDVERAVALVASFVR
jgi:selenocysteine lyase/cysteine desulfurase